MSRCAIAFYPVDDTAYLGLFASRNDSQACGTLISKVEAICRERGASRIVGPVDASFWIGYRFQTDSFLGVHYMGEPHNPRFYPELWRMCGFREYARYRAHLLPVPDSADVNAKCSARLSRARKMGYRFEHPGTLGVGAALEQMRKLTCKLLSDAEGFHPVSKMEFAKMTAELRVLADPSMLLLVYAPESDELVAFALCLPDVSQLGKDAGTIQKLKLRRASSRYVVSFMGVAPGHEGLAAAMSQFLRDALASKGAESVSFPVREGHAIREFYSESAVETRHYALYEKRLL